LRFGLCAFFKKNQNSFEFGIRKSVCQKIDALKFNAYNRIMMRRIRGAFQRKPDKILILSAALLIFLGIILLATVSVPYSLDKFNSPFYFLKRQLFFLLLGISGAYIIYKQSNLNCLKNLSTFLFFFNLILVFLTLIPGIGQKLGGATRWLSLGPFSFQPTEFLKLTFVIYLSAWLAERKKSKIWRKSKEQSLQVFLPFIILMLILIVLLYLQPDISTLGLIALTGLTLYFIAGTPKWQSFLLFFAGVLFLILAAQFSNYRFNRIAVFLNPNLDPMGIGYQSKQARITVGSGRIFGAEGGFSLGLSRQKFGFLPQPMSDSIFAIFSEETGFVGACFLIFLFLIFAWRGFKISKISEENDFFLAFLAFGITFWLVIQAFINIGAIIGVLPLTGIPLTFISYGGSALIAELLGLGILIKISSMVSR